MPKPRKLTPEDVRLIRAFYAVGVSQRKLAREFGVSQLAIHRVVHWLTYKEVVCLPMPT